MGGCLRVIFVQGSFSGNWNLSVLVYVCVFIHVRACVCVWAYVCACMCLCVKYVRMLYNLSVCACVTHRRMCRREYSCYSLMQCHHFPASSVALQLWPLNLLPSL